VLRVLQAMLTSTRWLPTEAIRSSIWSKRPGTRAQFAGPARGRSPPGLQCTAGEPDRERAVHLEPGLVLSPVLHSIPGLGVLVLAALGIPLGLWLQVQFAASSRCHPSGAIHQRPSEPVRARDSRVFLRDPA